MYPLSSPPRIFISYARSDGEDFAGQLRRRLTEEYRFAVWQDRTEMQVGESWWQQIVAALTNEHVEYMVLVMTPDAMRSEMVRKEWRRARQEGVCVLPVIAAPDLDFENLPPWMRAVHFSNPGIDEEWTHFICTLESPCQEKRVPFMVEDLPEDFVARPKEFNELVARLLNEKQDSAIAITAALRGAGGYGKTTLAKALCHNERIQEAFYDGILWVTLGENPGDLIGRVKDLIEILSGERSGFESSDAATSRLKELLSDRHILIVIDDVWNIAHLKPFIQDGPDCARLITTRDSSTLPESAERIPVDAMQKDEAVELLKTGLPPADEEVLKKLAGDLGEWPLLLKLVNSALREHVRSGMDIDSALDYVNEDLSELGLTAFDAEDPQERDQAAVATLGLSLKHLSKDERALYSELAIFPEDVDIPLYTLKKLWGATGDLKPVHIRRLCSKLYHRLSLLYTYDAANQTIRLHDVVRKYLIAEQEKKLRSIHKKFLDACRHRKWIDLPTSELYLWNHLAYHLVEAAQEDELRKLLFDYKWMQTKLDATDVNSLISDYDYLSDDSDLRLVQGAIRLSSNALAHDKTQLAGQLLGRLQCFSGSDYDDIQSMLEQARKWNGSQWLCPLQSSLTPPGGPLVRTLEGHTGPVSAVAVTPDGRFAVSASSDRTLKVWDFKKGEIVRTLEGHTDWVRAVAVTLDDRFAVSVSDDRTLKMWDIEKGETVCTLEGHTDSVNAVVVMMDGRFAVSASSDRTLKVWDFEKGEIVRTLEGHTGPVCAVAVTPDGRFAVSASDDRMLKVWDVKKGETVRTLKGHTGWVNGVAVTPDGRFAVSASYDGTLKVWDIEKGKTVRTLEGHTGWVNGVAVTMDGRFAVSASYDGTLTVWDIKKGKTVRTLEGHTDSVNGVAVTPDGRFAVSASRDRTLKVWDIEKGEAVRTLKGHTDWGSVVAVTPDDRFAFSASYYGALEVEDIEKGEKVKMLQGHTCALSAVAVTPDGRFAFSASIDETLKVEDIEKGERMRTLRGQTDSVNVVAVTPDGRFAVSASDDRTLKMWDLKTSKTVAGFSGDGALITCAISQDGGTIIAGDQLGRVHFIQLK
ncbi:MAG: TIR domain-containing protein [Methanosarcinales archaeon]|nr:TIR domain-containing protein [Methanosarcinales archaeon]